MEMKGKERGGGGERENRPEGRIYTHSESGLLNPSLHPSILSLDPRFQHRFDRRFKQRRRLRAIRPDYLGQDISKDFFRKTRNSLLRFVSHIVSRAHIMHTMLCC